MGREAHGAREAEPEIELPDTAQYLEFFEQATRARAQAERTRFSQIALAGSKDWKAAAWLLARTEPETWARSTPLRMRVPEGDGPVQVDV